LLISHLERERGGEGEGGEREIYYKSIANNNKIELQIAI